MGKITIDTDINLSDSGDATEDDYDRAAATFDGLPDVFTQIAAKRCHQDIKWGGAAHDDQHDAWDWKNILKTHVSRLTDSTCEAKFDYRSRLIDIAALACAAAQSWDRQHNSLVLRAKVFSAMKNAVQNGYALADWAPEDIAQDLLDSDVDLEGEEISEVQEFVSEWLAQNSVKEG